MIHAWRLIKDVVSSKQMLWSDINVLTKHIAENNELQKKLFAFNSLINIVVIHLYLNPLELLMTDHNKANCIHVSSMLNTVHMHFGSFKLALFLC